MVWAHILSGASAMMSPHDFREIMKAHFRYGETRTVDEVVAAHEARDKARDRNGGGASKTPPEMGPAASSALLEQARKMMNLAGANPAG